MKAEFIATLPDGDAFYARWPQSIDLDSLRMVRTVLGLTLDWWVDAADQRASGEVEYASWRLSQEPRAQPRQQHPKEPDEDGHCKRCGLEFEDPAELTHECPPGFSQEPADPKEKML